MEDPLKDDLALALKGEAEEALSASEARYRRLFETAQDGILILDGDSGLITDVNPFLVNLLDYPREDFIGRTLWDIGPFRHIEASKAAFQELQDKEYIRYENLPLEAKSGRRVNVEFVSNVYGVDSKRVIQCNIRDITARKHAEGTTFKVYLPRVEGEAEVVKGKATLPIQGGQETILLVEDNEPLRELAREMLEGLGYAVLDSGYPLEAIRAAEQHQGPIALLITDVVMPEVTGPALAETLKAVRPEMKVLYMSGYADDTCVEQGQLEAGYPLLGKPFTRGAFAKRVRELLDSPMS